jgi:hypothetical protein
MEKISSIAHTQLEQHRTMFARACDNHSALKGRHHEASLAAKAIRHRAPRP